MLKKLVFILGLTIAMAISFVFAGNGTVVQAEGDEYAFSVDYKTSATTEETGAIAFENFITFKNADHGALPGVSLSDPLQIADVSYVAYQLTAGEGKIFNTLSLTVNARIWNQNDDTVHSESRINVYYGYRETSINKLATTFNAGENAIKDYNVDLGEFANGYNKIFIKIELVQSKANCGMDCTNGVHNDGYPCSDKTIATPDGFINLSFLGVKLFGLNATGTVSEGESKEVADFSLESDFVKADLNSNSVFEKSGVACAPDEASRNEHGVIPALAWDGQVDTPEQSYIVYKLESDKGTVFDTLALDLSAKIWNQDDNDCHAKNSVKVYVSTDGVNYGEAVATFNAGANEKKNYEANLSSAVNGYSTVYVKIELNQYVKQFGNGHNENNLIDLWFIGAKLYGVNMEGYFKEQEFVTVNYVYNGIIVKTDYEQNVGIALAGAEISIEEGYELEGWYFDEGLTEKVVTDYVVGTEEITVYAKVVKTVYTVTYNLDGGENGNNPNMFTATDNVVLEDAVKQGYRFDGWYSNAQFMGEKVTAVSGTKNVELFAKFSKQYKIAYVLDGGVNAESNPSIYYSDEGCTLADATKEGYTFGGWYLDQGFILFADVIEEGSNEDVTLYAKWISNNPVDVGSDNANGTTNKRGCGSSASATSMLAIALLGVATVFAKKRK